MHEMVMKRATLYMSVTIVLSTAHSGRVRSISSTQKPSAGVSHLWHCTLTKHMLTMLMTSASDSDQFDCNT